MSGDILVITTGDRRVLLRLVGRGQDAAEHCVGLPPTAKNCPAQMLPVLTLRYPVLDCYACRADLGYKGRIVEEVVLLKIYFLLVGIEMGDWQEVWDENTGCYYYWNTQTNEVTWELPQCLATQVQGLQHYQPR